MARPTYFSWRANAPKMDLDPEVAWEEIRSIGESNGGLATAEAIVEASRSENALFHRYFEWDDSIAAEKHREAQARTLVGSIQVRYSQSPGVETRAFEITVQKDVRGYAPVDIILANPDERALLLQRAFAELASFKRRYTALSELSGVLLQIDDLLTRQGAAGQAGSG